MLWIVDGETSFKIIGCNIHNGEKVSQLWVTREGDKGLKLREGDMEEISMFKEAIDFAIETGSKVLKFK